VEELAWGIDDDGVPEAVHVIATDLVGPAPARQEHQAA